MVLRTVRAVRTVRTVRTVRVPRGRRPNATSAKASTAAGFTLWSSVPSLVLLSGPNSYHTIFPAG